MQFEGDELVLDHGSLQVNSARGMRVRVNCMTVIPLTQEWTRYDVIDADGKVTVVAYENDVKIHYRRAAARQSKHAGLADVTVHRGEQVTRDERCGAAAKPAEALDAKGAILNTIGPREPGLPRSAYSRAGLYAAGTNPSALTNLSAVPPGSFR